MSDVMAARQPPTVVLVHGAFADASSWNGVIDRLQAKGVPVTAPANPLRGLSVTEIPGSHVIMISNPETVAGVILNAVAACSSEPVVA
jgi:pimeloyl-ACP methyl ester carboxylesterase